MKLSQRQPYLPQMKSWLAFGNDQEVFAIVAIADVFSNAQELC